MFKPFRSCVSLLLALVMVGAGASTAAAAGDYRSPVDITFPTVSGARYSDDYTNGRSGGRIHRSTDLFAPMGVPVYAARGGRIIWLPQYEAGNAGFAIQIAGDDGRTYAYYHLGEAGGRFRDAVAQGLTAGSSVKRGQRIGSIGNSGNAVGTSPHLHFEIHDSSITDPYGGTRRNPYASLRKAQGLSVPATPTATTPAGASGVLQLGDRGPAVAEWQRELNKTRPDNMIETDGVFGPRTQKATAIFQKAVGMGANNLGIVGPKTREAVRRYLQRQQQPAAPPRAPSKPSSKPSSSDSSGAPILQLGDRGPAVAEWQRELNKSRPHLPIETDGVFGPRTAKATTLFQKGMGLGPTGLGIVGPKTREALRRYLNRH